MLDRYPVTIEHVAIAANDPSSIVKAAAIKHPLVDQSVHDAIMNSSDGLTKTFQTDVMKCPKVSMKNIKIGLNSDDSRLRKAAELALSQHPEATHSDLNKIYKTSQNPAAIDFAANRILRKEHK